MSHKPLVLTDTKGMDRKTWLEWRRKGIGGSDAAILFGIYPFGKTIWDLWNDKTGRTPIKDEPFNLTLEIGHALEDVLASYFTQLSGWPTFRDTNMYQHPNYPWMLADLDFMIDFGSGKFGILEDKTTSFFNKDEWADNQVPLKYEIQCRHYMAVMDIDVSYIVCLYDNNPNGFICRRITRDEKYERALISVEANFWNNFVIPAIEPEFVEPAKVALVSLEKHLSRFEKAGTVVLDSDPYYDHIVELLRLYGEKAKVEAAVRRIKNEIADHTLCIKEAMKTSKEALCGEFTLWYSSNKRRVCDYDKLLLKYPDIYTEVIRSSVSETLKITEDAVSMKKAS